MRYHVSSTQYRNRPGHITWPTRCAEVQHPFVWRASELLREACGSSWPNSLVDRAFVRCRVEVSHVLSAFKLRAVPAHLSNDMRCVANLVRHVVKRKVLHVQSAVLGTKDGVVVQLSLFLENVDDIDFNEVSASVWEKFRCAWAEFLTYSMTHFKRGYLSSKLIVTKVHYDCYETDFSGCCKEVIWCVKHLILAFRVAFLNVFGLHVQIPSIRALLVDAFLHAVSFR